MRDVVVEAQVLLAVPTPESTVQSPMRVLPEMEALDLHGPSMASCIAAVVVAETFTHLEHSALAVTVEVEMVNDAPLEFLLGTVSMEQVAVEVVGSVTAETVAVVL